MKKTSVFSDFYCLPSKLALMGHSPGLEYSIEKSRRACGTPFAIGFLLRWLEVSLLQCVSLPDQEEIAADTDQQPETNRDQRGVEASGLLY
jgi:hypothetical protein